MIFKVRDCGSLIKGGRCKERKKDNFILLWRIIDNFVDGLDVDRRYRKVGLKILWDLGFGLLS